MDKHKLGVIVPFRNRHYHLAEFKSEIIRYLSDRNIEYEIIVVEQDDKKQFNRGTLLNIGFKYAEDMGCDYVVFHDVDMLPVYVDYSYSEKPLHLSTDFVSRENEPPREIFSEYFGGVTMFPVNVFKEINGYSNKYWGWGYEDTDLLYRCKENNVELDILKIKNMGVNGNALKFNGIDSFVKCKNVIDFYENATFFVSFDPENIKFDHTKQTDEFTIFSIPGWDFSIYYSSFLRYNFCAFDSEKKILYVNSKIKPTYHTNMTVSINREENKIGVYQDGEFIGETREYRKLFFYRKNEYFYLGVGNPDRENNPNYFTGTISSFAYYNSLLSAEEIKEISLNKYNLLNVDFGVYKSSKSLMLYYDANYIENYELVDLSGNLNNGIIEKCEIINDIFEEYVKVKIPHRRRSLFESLKHEENGFFENQWKDQATRYNQLRFNNEVLLNRSLLENDGLSNLKFIEHNIINYHNNIKHINIGL
jgi:hypothetical protein